MKQDTNTHTASSTDGERSNVLVDEFVSDIRRRARAVECLLEPRRPPWSFDPDALPTDDAEKLVAIKREVEQTFNAIFSDRPRSRRPSGSGNGATGTRDGQNRSASRMTA